MLSRDFRTDRVRILPVALGLMILPVAVLIAGGIPGSANEPAKAGTPPLRQQLARLIEQLDSDSRAARIAAQQEILKLGPDVLNHLPAPAQLPNASVRVAVRQIRIELEHRAARESVRPARINLRATESLEQLTQSIAEQSGNLLDLSLRDDDARQRRFTVDWQMLPFWEAIADLEQQAGLVSELSENAAALILRPREVETDVASDESNSTAFRMRVLSVDRRKLRGNDRQHLVRMMLGITAEPRLRPLFLKVALDDIAARSADAGALPPYTPGAVLELPLGEGGRDLRVKLDYLIPSDTAATTLQLSGNMQMTTAAVPREILLRNVAEARNVERRAGGVNVTLRDVQFQPAAENESELTAAIRVAVSYDRGGPAFESHRSWIFHNRAWLQTATGKRIERDSRFTTTLQADGAVAVLYHFSGLTGDPAEFDFVYEAPTAILEVPLEFEFDRIPVPALKVDAPK